MQPIFRQVQRQAMFVLVTCDGDSDRGGSGSGIRKRASKFFCNCCCGCGHRLWAAAEKRPASDVVRAEGGSEWDTGASQRAQAGLKSFGARVLRRLTSQAENASS